MLLCVFVIECGQPQLPQIVLAGRSARCLPGRLHRGQEHADERGHNRDHHEQLNQGKPAAGRPPGTVSGTGHAASRQKKQGNMHSKVFPAKKMLLI